MAMFPALWEHPVVPVLHEESIEGCQHHFRLVTKSILGVAPNSASTTLILLSTNFSVNISDYIKPSWSRIGIHSRNAHLEDQTSKENHQKDRLAFLSVAFCSAPSLRAHRSGRSLAISDRNRSQTLRSAELLQKELFIGARLPFKRDCRFRVLCRYPIALRGCTLTSSGLSCHPCLLSLDFETVAAIGYSRPWGLWEFHVPTWRCNCSIQKNNCHCFPRATCGL